MSEQLLSTAFEVFCDRLEKDDVDDVSLELVRSRWIPEVTALEAKLSKMEEALSAFWEDRDNWDFDDQGVPETWYPVGAFAEALAIEADEH